MADLQLINGPTNIYEGPATGLSTEKGDSWHVAVGKMNAAIEHIGHALEGIGEGMDGSVIDRLTALEEAVAAIQLKLDGHAPAAVIPGIAALSEAEANIDAPAAEIAAT